MMYERRKFRRMLALVLALSLLMQAAPALAESGRAVVTADPLLIYAQPTLTGKSAKLSAYSIVNVAATQGNVAQLKNGKNIAYASLSGLTMIADKQTAIASRATRIYEKPNQKGRSVTIPKGFRMDLLFKSGELCIVENKGALGFAQASHLIIESPAEQPGDDGVVVETYAATVTASSLPVYKSASASSKKLGTLKAGEGVTVYARNDTWAYIGKGGNFGFCKLSGLERGQGSGDDVPENAIKVSVTAKSAKVYKKADSSSKLLGTLPKGTQVNLIRTEGKWAYIEYSGRYGYCTVSSLTSSSGDGNITGDIIDGKEPLGTATVIEANAPVYSAMNTNSQYVTLRMGETLSFYGYDNTWVLVGRDSSFGYMKRSALNALNYAELKLEDSGAGVLQLETLLLELGYLDNIPSSNYTAITSAAVGRLQSAIALAPTGSADLATLRVLYSGNAPASPLLGANLSKGSKNENVSRLQARLLALGYLSRESSVDGDYGSNTAGAVQLFQTAAGITATGTADSATIRALYSTSAPRLGSGQSPADQGSGGSTSSGGTSSGNTTNIPAGLASTTATYTPGMTNAEKLEHVIYTAQQQLGKRYVFGAAGPSTFDCSGLMLYCFKRVGISLQHSAKGEGYNENHRKISAKSSLIRGDMVFFNTVSDGDLCDHVGIYLGKNYVLHASSGSNKVIISTIASGYYSRVYSWGRRVLG